MKARSGFRAVVQVSLVVDLKTAQALQTPHTQITPDMDVRSPKRSHHVPNHSRAPRKEVSGEQGSSCEPSRSHELPNSQSGERQDSAMKSQGYGGLGQPLQGPWSYL